MNTDNQQIVRPTHVAPSSIRLVPDGARSQERWAKTIYVDSWPNRTKPGIIEPLTSHWSSAVDVTLDIDPMDQQRAVNIFQRKCADIETEMQTASSGTENRRLEERLNNHQKVLAHLENNDERVHHVGLYVTAWGEDRKSVSNTINDIIDQMGFRRVVMKPIDYKPLEGLITTSPIKKNGVKKRKRLAFGYDYMTPMLGSAVGSLYPFTFDTVTEESGIIYGYNSLNNSLITLDRYKRDNGYNVAIVGELGAGKSYGTKLWTLREKIKREEVIVIIMDPRGGFRPLVNGLDGDIHSVGGDTPINPLEINQTPQHIIDRIQSEDDSNYSPFNSNLDSKMDFWRTFFKQGSGEPMDGSMETVMRRAHEELYRKKGIERGKPRTHQNENPLVPELVDLLGDIESRTEKYIPSDSNLQKDMWETAAAKLQMRMDPFQKGQRYGALSQKSDFSISDSNLVYFNMSGQESSRSTDLSMQLVYDAIYSRVKNSDVPCIMIIDEFHQFLMDDEGNATDNDLSWLENSFRHSRHFNNSIQVLTQHANDFFVHPLATSMLGLTSMRIAFNQPKSSMSVETGKKLGFSERQTGMIRKLDHGSPTGGASQALVQADGVGTYPVDVVSTDGEEVLIDPEAAQKSGAVSREEDMYGSRAI